MVHAFAEMRREVSVSAAALETQNKTKTYVLLVLFITDFFWHYSYA